MPSAGPYSANGGNAATSRSSAGDAVGRAQGVELGLQLAGAGRPRPSPGPVAPEVNRTAASASGRSTGGSGAVQQRPPAGDVDQATWRAEQAPQPRRYAARRAIRRPGMPSSAGQREPARDADDVVGRRAAQGPRQPDGAQARVGEHDRPPRPASRRRPRRSGRRRAARAAPPGPRRGHPRARRDPRRARAPAGRAAPAGRTTDRPDGGRVAGASSSAVQVGRAVDAARGLQREPRPAAGRHVDPASSASASRDPRPGRARRSTRHASAALLRSVLGDEVRRPLVAVDVRVRQPLAQVAQVAVGEDRVARPPQQQRRHVGERRGPRSAIPSSVAALTCSGSSGMSATNSPTARRLAAVPVRRGERVADVGGQRGPRQRGRWPGRTSASPRRPRAAAPGCGPAG